MIATLTRSDAFREFALDPRVNRFRIVDKNGRGRFISRQAFNARLANYIQQQQRGLIALSDELSEGSIDLRQFQLKAATYLRELISSTALTLGPEKLKPSDWAIVRRHILEQLYEGKRADGTPFGIRWLADSLAKGEVSPAQLRQRLTLYSLSSKRTYHAIDREIKKREGMRYGKRVLGATDRHCAECVSFSQKPWLPIDEVQPIATDCSCGNRCRCSISYSESIPKAERNKQELEQILNKGFGNRRR